MQHADFQIVKRNGHKESFDYKKIEKVIHWAVKGIENVNAEELLAGAKITFFNGITTKEIHQAVIETAVNFITVEKPNYQYVASRLLNYSLRKSVWGGKHAPRLLDMIKDNLARGFYDKFLIEKYSVKEINKISEFIDHERDFSFTHGGLRQLIDKYLVQDRQTKEVFETPQFVYVLVAMTLFADEKKNRMEWIKKAYDYFSTFKINLATPVIAGCRTPLRSYASCALFNVGDSLDSIGTHDYLFKKASAARYGLGLNISAMRPVGAKIRHGDVLHTGLVPYLKNFEAGILSSHQNGLRGSSGTVFINFWHYEVEEVCGLKNNALPDDKAVRFLDYCVCMSGLFLDRVKNNEEITLFNPHEVPDLLEKFGTREWNDLYVKREGDETIKMKKKISARKLMGVIAKQRLETGRIYVMFADNANQHGSFKETVQQSNLCVTGDTVIGVYQPDGLMKNIRIDSLSAYDFSKDFVYVLARDFETGLDGFHKINNFAQTGNAIEVIEISDESGRVLRCTPEHEIFTQNRGYVKAEALQAQDILVINKPCYSSSSGLTVVKKSILQEPVYDITVERVSNFYANNILVHNCVEVIQPTKPSEKWNDENGLIGVCILSALNPYNIKDEEYESVCEVAVRMLDNLIDYQSYFDIAAKNFATKYRSLGIGTINFAGWMAKNKTRYISENAPNLAASFAEKLSYYCIKASIGLAKERGKCEYFDKTRWADASLPIDHYSKSVDEFVTQPLKLDWEGLRAELKKHGIRNASLTCHMPCESSASISGSTSGLEPIRDYIVAKISRAGKLVSVAPDIEKYKEYYTLAFDMVDNDALLKIYAAIGKFTDMSISANTYLNVSHYENKQIPLSTVIKTIFNAHSYGLKTLYYNNTEDAGGEQDGGCGDACKL